MIITQVLDQNRKRYGDEISLIEVNPEAREKDAALWKEYDLVETGREDHYRRVMTWLEFDQKANRFANLLQSRGIGPGRKVAILLMNCLEWLPIYFGILKKRRGCRSAQFSIQRRRDPLLSRTVRIRRDRVRPGICRAHVACRAEACAADRSVLFCRGKLPRFCGKL